MATSPSLVRTQSAEEVAADRRNVNGKQRSWGASCIEEQHVPRNGPCVSTAYESKPSNRSPRSPIAMPAELPGSTRKSKKRPKRKQKRNRKRQPQQDTPCATRESPACQASPETRPPKRPTTAPTVAPEVLQKQPSPKEVATRGLETAEEAFSEMYRTPGLQQFTKDHQEWWLKQPKSLRAAAKEHDLSGAELAVLTAFTSEPKKGFRSLCNAMKQTLCDNSGGFDPHNLLATTLYRGLEKFPPLYFDVAWRGLSILPGDTSLESVFEGKKWNRDDIVTLPAFSSFSKKHAVAASFANRTEHGIILCVLGGHFRSIKDISVNGREDELLALPPTHYRVVKKNTGNRSQKVVTVELVPIELPTTAGSRVHGAFVEQPLRLETYTEEHDKLVDQFAEQGCYSEVTVADLSSQVGELYKAKFTLCDSVTKHMELDDHAAPPKGRCNMPDSISTKLTLIEDNNVNRLDSISVLDVMQCGSCRDQGGPRRCDCRKLLVVEGRAGIGKSTFAMDLGRSQPSASWVFVVLSLGSLATFLPPHVPGQPLSMLQLIGIALSPFATSSSAPSADVLKLEGVQKGTVEMLWGSKHVPIVWVLDGLDEVTERSDPRLTDFLAQILNTTGSEKTSFWKRRPLDAVIVTSREEKGFFGTYLSRKPTLQIDTWGTEEVKQYVRSYFGTDEGSTSKRVTDILLSSTLGSFAKLPITCELLCCVLRNEPDIDVTNVAAVYEKALESIYNINAQRRTKAAEAGKADDPILTSVDFATVRNRAAQLALTIATDMGHSGDDSSPSSPAGLLVVEVPKRDSADFSLINSGWLRRVSGNRYQFVHKSFMEYFAAYALAADLSALEAFAIDVGGLAQQRNLLVLLASILVQKHKTPSEPRIEALIEKVVESFRSRCGQTNPRVSKPLRDEEGSCSTLSEIAQVMDRLSSHCTAFEGDYCTLCPAPFPEIDDLASPLLNRIDHFAQKPGWLSSTQVLDEYSQMIEPMAEQNALKPLMYVQRRILSNSTLHDSLQEHKIYEKALLRAELTGAKDTAHFLVEHCDAHLDLMLAADIGATAVLRHHLASAANFHEQVGKLITHALISKRLESIGVILSIAFKKWPGKLSRGKKLLEVARRALEAGSDLMPDEMLGVFGNEAGALFTPGKPRVLDLTQYQFNDCYSVDAMQFVCRAIRATELRLDGTNVTLAALRGLKNRDVRSLSLRDTQLDDSAARAFASVQGLTELDLSGVMNFGDEGLAGLQHCPCLCRLNLERTAVTGVGLLRAAKLLRRLDSITIPTLNGGCSPTFSNENVPVSDQVLELDLRSMDGSNLSALLDILCFARLKSVDLRGCNVEDADLAYLLQCDSLRKVDLRDTCVSDPCLFESEREHALCHVRKIVISLQEGTENTPSPAREMLHRLHSISSLASLTLHGHVTAVDMDTIGCVPNVTTLKFSDLIGVARVLEKVHRVFPGLEELSLRGLSVIDTYLSGLVPCIALKSLDLSDTDVSEQIRKLGDAQQLLQEVTLQDAAANGHTRACEIIIKRYERERMQVDDVVARPGTFADDMVTSATPPSDTSPKPSWTPLFHAALNGFVEICEMLIAAGADVNRCDENGVTTLHLAAVRGHVGVCKALVSNGADIANAVSLCAAASHGHFETFALLLANGADIRLAPKDAMNLLLMCAAEIGSTRTCERLLACDADVNHADSEALTPLAVAARNGHKETCAMLLDRGGDVNSTNVNGATCLFLAAQKGQTKTCRLLLDRGVDVSHRRSDGATPLHLAARQGHRDTCSLLLSYGADVSLSDSRSETPLSVAACNGHTKTCHLLFENGSEMTNSLLSRVAMHGHDSACQLLLDHKAEVDSAGEDGVTALWIAVDNGKAEACEVLLKGGAEVDRVHAGGKTPLCLAAEKGHEAACRLLLDRGASVNHQQDNRSSPLFLAAEGGHSTTCELLLSRGADVSLENDDEWPPLFIAAANGHTETCRVLFKHDARMNYVMSDGRQLLFLAVKNGHHSTCQLLLSQGADVNREDMNNESPLFVAAEMGDRTLCRLLGDHGADVNQVNIDGRTALFSAAKGGHKTTCETLLDFKAGVTAEDKAGQTPLHAAAENGQLATCKLLVARGGNVNAMDKRGRTPLTLAQSHTETCQWLKENGATSGEKSLCRLVFF